MSARRRSMLLHGLRLMLRHPAAVLWTYAANLGIAALFTLRFHAQVSDVLNHSLAAERLNSAFDLGTLQALMERLEHRAPATGIGNSLGVPVYLLVYFVLVPGALFCYRADAPARLRTMLDSGLSFLWSFVRITLLTALFGGAILVPIGFAQSAWMDYISERTVGRQAFLAELPGLFLIVLLAALVRLYFDLVEVYTVQLAERTRANGKPDRRVRRVLMPALRTLGSNLPRAYASFVLLLALAGMCTFFGASMAAHRLAQPRVWPMFLLAQAGLLGMLACRFWQRASLTILAGDNPLPLPSVLLPMPEELPEDPHDALPNPEPEVPSLPEPDPGVYHHEPNPLVEDSTL